MIGVLQDDDAVLEFLLKIRFALGVGIALGNPQAAAGVPSHIDGLLHHWLGRGKLHTKALGHGDRLERLGGFEEGDGDFLRVERRRGLVVGAEGAGENNGGKAAENHGVRFLGLFLFGLFRGGLLRLRSPASFSSCCT